MGINELQLHIMTYVNLTNKTSSEINETNMAIVLWSSKIDKTIIHGYLMGAEDGNSN